MLTKGATIEMKYHQKEKFEQVCKENGTTMERVLEIFEEQDLDFGSDPLDFDPVPAVMRFQWRETKEGYNFWYNFGLPKHRGLNDEN